MPMQAFMIGLDMVKEAFLHIIWANIVCFALIFVLGSRPEWRMDGVIVGMNTEAMLLALMHYLTICKKIGVTVFMKGLIGKTTE